MEYESWIFTLLKNISDAIIIIDKVGEIVSINPSAELLIGWKQAESLGKPLNSVFNIINEQTGQLIENFVEKLLQEGKMIDFLNNVLLISKNGKERPIDVNCMPIKNQEGNITRIVLIFRESPQRRKTKKILRKKGNLLHKFGNNYPDFYLLKIEKDFTVSFKSGQEFKNQNLDSKDFFGLTLKEVFGPHASIVKKYYLKTFAGEKVSFELYINNQHLYYKTLPFYNEKGEINQILVFVKNITKRKQTKLSLQDTKLLYQTIFKQSPDGIVIINPQTMKAVEFNDTICQLLHYSRKEFATLKVTDYGKIKDFENMKIHIEKIIQKGRENFETELRTKDGKIKNIYATIQLIELSREKYLFSIIRDITEQKRLDELLKVQRDLAFKMLEIENYSEALTYIFRSLIDVIGFDSGGVYIINEENNALILHYNEGLSKKFIEEVKYYGLDTSNFKIVQKDKLLYIDYDKLAVHKTDAELNEGLKSIIIIPINNQNHVLGCLNLASHTKKAIPRCLKTIIETLRTQIKQAIHRLHISAALKVSEKQYRQAYARASFYRDLFAHDMNNILQNLLGSAEMLAFYMDKPKTQDKVKKLFTIIKNQIKRGTNLISNVQKLSILEETKSLLVKTDILEVLNRAITNIQEGFSNKKFNIQVDFPSDKLFIKANELLIDVFDNILTNAVKYNKNSPIKIFIKVKKQQKEGNKFLKLEFKDNGIGIEDARKEIIFRKGFNIKNSVGGMGIGLVLVKQIIASYNGQIKIEDKVKGDFTKGSNFIILIP
ncbi:MAG: PAS domain S-box protein, partial [Promethearchaeota archaeon]